MPMHKTKLEKVELTEKEADLIRLIRNLRKVYPPSQQLLYYAQQLFDELIEGNEEQENIKD